MHNYATNSICLFSSAVFLQSLILTFKSFILFTFSRVIVHNRLIRINLATRSNLRATLISSRQTISLKSCVHNWRNSRWATNPTKPQLQQQPQPQQQQLLPLLIRYKFVLFCLLFSVHLSFSLIIQPLKKQTCQTFKTMHDTTHKMYLFDTDIIVPTLFFCTVEWGDRQEG